MNTQRMSASRPWTMTWMALFAAIALLVSACGGDDDDEGAAAGDDEATTTTAAESDPADGDAEGPGPAPQPLDEETDVNIVMAFNIEPFAPALLADYFGEFEKENLNVTIQNVPSNEATVMVAQGQAHLKVGGIGAAFYNAVDSGVDVVWLANVHQNDADSKEGVWLRNDFFDEDGNVIEEKLKGAKIAAGSGGIGSPSAFAINGFLQDHGASLDDIESPAIGGSDMLIAIENGGLDGGYVLTPQWIELDNGDDAQYGGLYGGFGGEGFSASAYEMNGAFIEDQPDVAAAIMRAIARTVATYLQGDYHADEEVLAALAEVTGTPGDAIASAPPLVFSPEMPINGDMIEDIQQMWIDFAPDTLSFSEPLPLEQLVDRSIVDRVLEGG